MSETTNSSEEKEPKPKTEQMSREDFMLAEHKVQTGISDILPGGKTVKEVQKEQLELQQKQEQELRDFVAADPARQSKYGAAWDEIAKATLIENDIGQRYGFIEGGRGFLSRYYDYARTPNPFPSGFAPDPN